jgi:ERF superfamily
MGEIPSRKPRAARALAVSPPADGAWIVEAPPSLPSLIAAAAANPQTDVAKLSALLAEHRRIMADEAALQFSNALAAAQAEVEQVKRNTPNTSTGSKYAPLDDIDAMARPVYTRHGFALSFTEAPTDGTVRLSCIVRRGAHSETYTLSAPADVAGFKGTSNKTPIQGVVSSVTYLRRALLCMVFNIVTRGDDRDGNRVDTGEVISRVQLAELVSLMAETRILESVVLAKMAPGVSEIADLPVGEFSRIRNALASRRIALARKPTDLGDALRRSLNGETHA